MRASLSILNGTEWAKPVQFKDKQSIADTANNTDGTHIINVFDCNLSLKAFTEKERQLINKPFTIKELVTKKGEPYYCMLISPTFKSTECDY